LEEKKPQIPNKEDEVAGIAGGSLGSVSVGGIVGGFL